MSCSVLHEAHDYTVLSRNYYKYSGERGPWGPQYDQTVSYSTLFCARCGDTKEVVSQTREKVAVS